MISGCRHRVSTQADATTFPGANASEQINNCIASIPKGGICDATGYGATIQTIASTVSIGVWPAATGTQSVHFSKATRFQPAGASLQMFKLGAHADVDGLHVDCSNQPQFTGTAVQISGYLTLSNSTPVAAHFRNFILEGGTATPVAASTGIQLTTASSSASTYYVMVAEGSIGGFYSGIMLYAPPDSVGGVNANSFAHLRMNKTAYGINLYGASGYTGGPSLQLSGNNFTDVNVQQDANSLAGIFIRGAAQGNSFLSVSLFDGGQGVLLQSAGTPLAKTGIFNNFFMGYLAPISENIPSAAGGGLNLWDCLNCVNNESRRNIMKLHGTKLDY